MKISTKQNHLNSAQKGALLGILTYLILSIIKIWGSFIFKSEALRADGFNNLTDIFSSLSVFIGLYIAKRPADKDHHFGHDKYEAISSFIVSIIMFFLGIDIINKAILTIVNRDYLTVNIMAITLPIISVIILFTAYINLVELAHKSQSIGLKATSKDMRNDLFITIGTIIGIIGTNIGLPWLDATISLFLGVIIIISAIEILKDSTFTLSDGFNENEINHYFQAISQHPDVMRVTSIRARLSGNVTYVDVTIEIDGKLSVYTSHQITEEIEGIMKYKFNVRDVDVHVEPYTKIEK